MSGGLPSGHLESDLEVSPHPTVPTSLWERGPSSICLFWWKGAQSGWDLGTLLSGLSVWGGNIQEGVDTPS